MIGLVDVAKDSGLQFRDGPEHSTPETLPCELGKEALHGVEPGRRCRSEVEGPASMPSEPFAHLRMLVARVIVDNSVDRLSFGNLGLDGAEEADELLMSVARHATAGHPPFKDVESSEQGRGAMALVVMGHGAGSSLFHRQPRLGPHTTTASRRSSLRPHLLKRRPAVPVMPLRLQRLEIEPVALFRRLAGMSPMAYLARWLALGRADPA
jgi:hypothetical protein